MIEPTFARDSPARPLAFRTATLCPAQVGKIAEEGNYIATNSIVVVTRLSRSICVALAVEVSICPVSVLNQISEAPCLLDRED